MTDEFEERIQCKRMENGIFLSGLTEEAKDAKSSPPLDTDWQQLVKEAMASGKSKSQFKEFLELFR